MGELHDFFEERARIDRERNPEKYKAMDEAYTLANNVYQDLDSRGLMPSLPVAAPGQRFIVWCYPRGMGKTPVIIPSYLGEDFDVKSAVFGQLENLFFRINAQNEARRGNF